MSRRTKSSVSLKSLVKKSSEIDAKLARQVLVQSSPEPSALLASAILCRALKHSGHLFHFSVCSPLLDPNNVNGLKEQHESKSLVFVGVHLQGKKRLTKGTGYPIFLGGSCESEQAIKLQIGDHITTTAASYAYASSLLQTREYELDLAATGAILTEGFESVKTKANQELVDAASEANRLEERKGIRLVGVDRLQLNDVFFSSTRPFLRGLSGNRSSCDEAMNEADIPSTKFRSPISELSTKERERLVRSLVSRTDSSFLGKDFILINEKGQSPLRSVFETGALLETAWARGEFGLAFSVLLGDRSSSLRELIDSQGKHNEEVVSIIRSYQASLQNDEKVSNQIELSSENDPLLTDVARIIFELSLMPDETDIISVSNKGSTEVMWRGDGIPYVLVLQESGGDKPKPTATSYRSVRFPRLSEEDAKKAMADILKLGGKK